MSGTGSNIRSTQSLAAAEPRSGSSGSALRPGTPGVSPPGDKEPTVISTRTPIEVAAPSGAPPAAPAEHIGPGTRLGNFELLECVGGGGMGRVFRARDTALARTVAVKVLSREQAADGEVLLRFRNEAQTAARLNHENIVHVYHTGEDNGVAYIVFEFIDGMNIRTLVERQGSLPLSEAISYTFQIAEALSHAAEKNVVHRDIKPSNILITNQGHAKLIDLGLARLQKLSNDTGDLTASGVTLGTFDYISPEQARDPRTVDVRSDIYSLGCTLFFMLAGRPPFVEGTVLQKLLQHQGEEPPDVRQYRPELPVETSRLLKRMTAKDPRRRFQNPQQLIEALVLLAQDLRLQPAGPGEKNWVSEQHPRIPLLQRHLPWMAPAAILAIAVLAMNSLWEPSTVPADPSLRSSVPIDKSSTIAPPPRSGPLAQAGSAANSPVGVTGSTDMKAERGIVPAAENETRAETSPEAGAPAPTPIAAPALVSAGTKGAERRPSSVESQPPSGTSPAGEVQPELFGQKAFPSEPSPRAAATGTATGPRTPPSETNPLAVASIGSSVPPPLAKVGTSEGVKLVDPVTSGTNRFPTLGAACAAAAPGDVVELRFNGPRQEGPLSLRNLKLTVRAAEGYRPVIVFRPADMEPAARSRAMLSVSGSQLTLVNIALVLEIPREAIYDQWSLLESRSAESIRLEKCSLSIHNTSQQLGAYHPDVAFFRVRAAPGAGSLLSRETAAAPQRATIALVDCVLRGEAVALYAHDLWPIQFSWENGLLVTSERFLIADGGERTPLPGENLQIALRHVTAVTLGGLCRFVQSPSGPPLLATQIDCRNSILVGGPSAAMVEHVGVSSPEAARQAFTWNGDRNFYEGFGNFWSIRAAGSAATPVEPMSFEAWCEYWTPRGENVPRWRQVQWKQLPAADRPLPSHVPADYALSTSPASANPALGAASDGRDAGCLLDRLPPLATPAQSVPAAPHARQSSENDSGPAASDRDIKAYSPGATP